MSARRLFLCCSVILVAGAARAQQRGVLVAPAALDAASRKALAADVAHARAVQPGAFAELAALRAQVADLDARKRGPIAPIALELKGLGPQALLPMLEMVALSAEPRGELTDSAWLALRSGLLEAVGQLRDPRAAPVLRAVLASDVTDHLVVRAAAEALGRLGDEAAVATLLAAADGPKRTSVLTGMGACRRAKIAEKLAHELDLRPAPVEAKMLARSLSDVGNSWAWALPVVAASGEGAATRAIAARSLVSAYLAYEGDVRDDVSNALLVVDDPSTPGLIAAVARTASAEQRAALEKLSARFARNPVHRQ